MRRLNSFNFTTHDEVASFYNLKFTEMGQSWHVPPEELDDFLDRLGVWQVNDDKTWSLVEFGCGDGKLLERALLRGGSVSGIDISEVALKFAQSRLSALTKEDDGRWILFQDPMEQTGFQDAIVDFVISYGSLEHSLDIQAAINEFARILKPGGRWLNYAPNSEWIHEDQPLETTMEPDEWQKIYDVAGLVVESVTRVGDNCIYVGYKP